MKGIITIKTKQVPQFRIMAEVIGQLAVHMRVDGGKRGWAITHINSGEMFCCWTHRHVAINYARRMDKLIDFDLWRQSRDYRIQWQGYILNSFKHPAFIEGVGCAHS